MIYDCLIIDDEKLLADSTAEYFIVNDKIKFTKSYKETLTVHLAQPMHGMLYQRYL